MTRKSRFVFKDILFCISLTGVVLPGLPPDLQAASSSAIQEFHPSDIVIPPDIGYVVEAHDPSSSASHATPMPLIIHIQEAHVNDEAQRHVVAILEQLVKQYGLKLILVEGGQGDMGLSPLRKLSSPGHRKQVAEKYLKLGLISAEEYLDLASDYSLELWGVEDTELYERNVEALLAVESSRRAIEPLLASVREAIETLTPRVHDPVLGELVTTMKAFEEEHLSVEEYAASLSALASRQGLGLDSSPNLRIFLTVKQLEQEIHPDAVTKEQRVLFQRLRLHGDGQALDQLLTQVKHAGDKSPEPFYLGLEQLASKAGIAVQDVCPELFRYVRYLKTRRGLNPTALANELDQLAHGLRARIAASTPQGQRLAAVADQLELVEKLAQTKLNPTEYDRLSASPLNSLLADWSSTLNDLLVAHGFPARSFDGLAQLETTMPILRRFYETAEQRNAVMVERTVKKLRESREPLAVLITGGFHSPAITRMLEERHIQVVVVAPKVIQATDEERYRAILRLKSGHATSEEVQRMMTELTSSATSHPLQSSPSEARDSGRSMNQPMPPTGGKTE